MVSWRTGTGPPMLVFPPARRRVEMDRQGMIGPWRISSRAGASRSSVSTPTARRVLQQGRASLPPQLHAGAVRRLRAVRSVPFIRLHCQSDDIGIARWRLARRVPRGEFPLQAPDVFRRCYACQRLRHEALHDGCTTTTSTSTTPSTTCRRWTTARERVARRCEIHLATATALGRQGTDVPDGRHPCEQRPSALPRRLGLARRPRLAVLEAQMREYLSRW